MFLVRRKKNRWPINRGEEAGVMLDDEWSHR